MLSVPSPFTAPPGVPEKRWRRGALTLRAPPVGFFLAAPRSPPLSAIGWFLRRQTGNLISQAPASRPPPPLGRDRFGTGSTGGICAAASRFQLVVSRGVAVLIAGGISLLDLAASPRRRELVTYPLVGGAKAPWGGLAAAAARLQARQIAFPSRRNTPPPRAPVRTPLLLLDRLLCPAAPLSGSCVRGLFEVAYQQIWIVVARQ